MSKQYFLARLKLHYGALNDWTETFAPLIPVFEELGWKMRGSYHTIVGDIFEVVNIWEIRDANAIGEARLAARDFQAYKDHGPKLKTLIDREELVILEGNPFNPE